MGKSRKIDIKTNQSSDTPRNKFKKINRLQVKKQIHEVDDYENLDDVFDTVEKIKPRQRI